MYTPTESVTRNNVINSMYNEENQIDLIEWKLNLFSFCKKFLWTPYFTPCETTELWYGKMFLLLLCSFQSPQSPFNRRRLKNLLLSAHV